MKKFELTISSCLGVHTVVVEALSSSDAKRRFTRDMFAGSSSRVVGVRKLSESQKVSP